MPQYVVQQQGLDSIVVMAGEGQVVLYVVHLHHYSGTGPAEARLQWGERR